MIPPPAERPRAAMVELRAALRTHTCHTTTTAMSIVITIVIIINTTIVTIHIYIYIEIYNVYTYIHIYIYICLYRQRDIEISRTHRVHTKQDARGSAQSFVAPFPPICPGGRGRGPLRERGRSSGASALACARTVAGGVGGGSLLGRVSAIAARQTAWGRSPWQG